MSREDMLNAAIDDKTNPIFMKSKAQIVEYFTDKHGGNKTKAVSEIARTLSGESRGKAYQHARRNFEGARLHQTGDTKKWKSLGQALPAIGKELKNNSITLTVKGKQKTGKNGHTRDKTIKVTLKGADAQAFITNPSFKDIWEEYGVDYELFEDGDYMIDVSGVY